MMLELSHTVVLWVSDPLQWNSPRLPMPYPVLDLT